MEPQLVGVDGCLAFRFIGVLGVHESARRAILSKPINLHGIYYVNFPSGKAYLVGGPKPARRIRAVPIFKTRTIR